MPLSRSDRFNRCGPQVRKEYQGIYVLLYKEADVICKLSLFESARVRLI